MTNFDIDCQLPTTVGVFAGSPNARGTLDIIWSCFSVLVVCTWTVLHPNVPLQTVCRTRAQKYLRSAERLLWKVVWMSINVLAPEWALGKALADRRAMAATQRAFETFIREEAVDKDIPWTPVHTGLANLGGFTIVFDATTPPAIDDLEKQQPGTAAASGKTAADNGTHPSTANTAGTTDDVEAGPKTAEDDASPTAPPTDKTTAALTPQPARIPERCRTGLARFRKERRFRMQPRRTTGDVLYTADEAHFAAVAQAIEHPQMGYFATRWERHRFLLKPMSWANNLWALQTSHWVLDANQLLLARRLGILDRLPRVSEDDVADRNKGDALVKIVATGQVLWFVVALVVRLAAGADRTPTTLLEVLTLSFAVCTAVTYALLLDKPQGVQHAVPLPAARRATTAEMARLAVHGPSLYMVNRRWDLSIPNNALHADHSDALAQNNGSLLAGASGSIFIFGGLHCLAWNFAFPTHVERRLWQASSLLTAGVIPAAVLLYQVCILALYAVRLGRKPLGSFANTNVSRVIGVVLMSVGGLLFVGSRLFILVEVFRSLAFLPPLTFATTVWSVSIPHIG